MSDKDSSDKEVFFEPLRATDISPTVLVFYLAAIALLVSIWSGFLVVNSSLLKFGAVLLLAAVIFGVVRSVMRLSRSRS